MNIRDATKAMHDKVEETPFAIKLMTGKLSRQEYFNYLKVQRHIFSDMEYRWSYDILNGLARTTKIDADIDEMLRGDQPLENNNFDATLMLEICEYSRFMGRCRDPVTKLYTKDYEIANIYLNYMGLMFGGGIAAKLGYTTEGNIYNFESRNELIRYIRSLDVNADIVNEAFQYHINIFEALDNQ
tara:strand:+ start:23975 stop:24529 length:555 start_codon:yes stop_codon:yes gene_type:complete